MVIKSVNLETVCGITSTIPDNEYNEVAFAVKSPGAITTIEGNARMIAKSSVA